VRDSNGNIVSTTVKATVSSESDGSILGQYVLNSQETSVWTMTAAGKYRLTVSSLSGGSLSNSPVVFTVIPGVLDAVASKLLSPLKAGVGLGGTVTVRANDNYGNSRTYGFDEITVSVNGPIGAAVQTVSTSFLLSVNSETRDFEGSFSLPNLEANYALSVIMMGVHMQGSPFVFQSISNTGPPVLSNSLFKGLGVTKAIAGTPASFVIALRNSDGIQSQNAVAFGSIRLTFSEVSTSVTAVFNGDGTYNVTYTLSNVGTTSPPVSYRVYTVTASFTTFDASKVQSGVLSSWNVYLYPASFSATGSSVVMTSKTQTAGKPVSFTLISRDSLLNLLEYNPIGFSTMASISVAVDSSSTS